MPKMTVTMTLDVTDAEQSNFLARLSGVLGKEPTDVSVNGAATTTAAATDDDGPVDPSAPSVDAKGYPWNAEFHASTRGRNQDGTWKSKRGHDKAKLAAWEASIAPAAVVIPAAPVAAAPAIPGFAPPAIPGFAPPQAAPVDVPISMEMISAAFGKLNTMGLLTADGSNVTDLYGQIGMTSGDQLNTDETIRRKLLDALRGRFPQAAL